MANKPEEIKDEEMSETEGGAGMPWCNSYKAYQARTYKVCPTYNTCPTKGLCKATSQGEVKD